MENIKRYQEIQSNMGEVLFSILQYTTKHDFKSQAWYLSGE